MEKKTGNDCEQPDGISVTVSMNTELIMRSNYTVNHGYCGTLTCRDRFDGLLRTIRPAINHGVLN